MAFAFCVFRLILFDPLSAASLWTVRDSAWDSHSAKH